MRCAALTLWLVCVPALWSQAEEVRIFGEQPGPQARFDAVRKSLVPLQTPEEMALLLSDPYAGLWTLAAKHSVFDKAYEEYAGMLLDDPAALIQFPAESPLHGGRRSVCFHVGFAQALGWLPPHYLRKYRSEIEDESQRLLTLGKEKRTPEPLLRLVRESGLSEAGEDALDALGDLAFERGRFDEALAWWGQLQPMPSETETGPMPSRYRHFQGERGRVQAKLILGVIFQGDFGRADFEIAAFAKRHPQARGRFAGQDGLYADILADWYRKRHALREENEAASWPTFGGGFGRNHAASYLPTAAWWRDGPAWRVPIASGDGKHPAERFMFQKHAAVHPLVSDGQVVVGDALSVTSYDALTGEVCFRYEHAQAMEVADDKTLFGQQPRYTLSAGSGRVFARLGRLRVAAADKKDKTPASVLVCLNLASRKGELLWSVKATSAEGEPATFEGAPIVDAERVYLLQSEVLGLTTKSSLACYDLQGKRRWLTELSQSQELAEGRGARYRHHLLSQAGHLLIAVTHGGAVSAIDARTGEQVWALRYPRGSAEKDTAPRELLPALIAQGRALVAPADADGVLCLDVPTGRVLWERDDVEAMQLLGESAGVVLIAQRHGLAGLNLHTGATRWQQPSLGKLPSLGRGLLAEGYYLWPTHDGLLPYRTIRIRDGSPLGRFELTELRHLPAGNVVLGGGCLVVATPTELVCYPRPDLLKAPLQAKRSSPPPQAVPQATRRVQMLKALPTKLHWTQEGALFPSTADLYEIAAGTICRRDAQSGGVLWRQKLRYTHVTWIGRHGDVTIAAGPLGVEAWRDDQAAWSHPLPTRCADPLETLGDFQLQDGRLTFRFDQRQMFVLNPETGKLTESRWCTDGPVRPLIGGKFEESGEPLQATEPGTVHWQSARESKSRWTYSVPWQTSLSGTPPKTLVQGSMILASFATALGDVAVRLDEKTGQSRWTLPPGEAPEMEGSVCAQGKWVAVSGTKLQARDAATGTLAWQRELPLPARAWQIDASPAGLLVYPRSQAKMVREYPVWCVHAQDGTLLWNERFDCKGQPGLVVSDSERIIVSVGGQIACWGN